MNFNGRLAISVTELAHTLGVGESKAREIVRRPDFPAIRDGRRILIPVSALEKWLEAQAEKGA